jgi:hypothetical protein
MTGLGFKSKLDMWKNKSKKCNSTDMNSRRNSITILDNNYKKSEGLEQ